MPSKKKGVCFVALCVATVAAICIIYLEVHKYSMTLVFIALTNLTVGFLVGGLSSRVWARFVGWFVGALIVALALVSPLLFEGGWGSAMAALAFIKLYPLGLAILGAGTLLGYFAHPLIARSLTDLVRAATREPEPYQGPRCVRCAEPIEPGVWLCPKCGWTQPV